jgi:hypothetical protein
VESAVPVDADRAAQVAEVAKTAASEEPRAERRERAPREVIPNDGSVVEIYASAGRRQGAKPSDYERQLKEAGIGAEAIAYVRVRHRNAFVGVDRTAQDRALAALDGATIAGTRVKAELSRGRPANAENDVAESAVEE